METMEKIEWDIYPFSYLGFNYQSRIRCDSYEGSMARKMPINNFIVMNKGILRGTVGVRKNSTLRLIAMPKVGDYQILYKGKKKAPAWAIAEQHHLEFWLPHNMDCDCEDCFIGNSNEDAGFEMELGLE